MLIKSLLTLLNCLLIQAAYCDQVVRDSFHIQGYSSIPVTKVYLTYPGNDNHLVKDSSLVVNNRFSFRGHINYYSRLCALSYKTSEGNKRNTIAREYNVSIENSTLEFWLNNDGVTVKGNATDKEIDGFLNDGIKTILNSIDLYQEKIVQDKENSLRFQALQNRYSGYLIAFSKEHADHNSMPYLLVKSREYIHTAVTDSLFFLLTPRQQNSYYGQTYKRGYERRQLKLTQPGTLVTDFKTAGHSGSNVSLYENTGKGYVLLDFWASWCNPCRASHPHLIDLYKKYRRQNFQVISISCDEEKDRNKWLQAIQKDGIAAWPNILTASPGNNTPAKGSDLREVYKVTSFPTIFLIDTSNRIIGRYDDEDALDRKLKEIYGK